MKKIELTTLEQQTRKFEKTHRITVCTSLPIRREEGGVQDYISVISNPGNMQGKAQLNVSFASPLESCRLYTPSPSVSMASTLDIQSETDICEGEQEILSRTASCTDIKSENKPFDTCDTHDQPSIASQDNYSNPAAHIDFSTTELNDSTLSSAKNWKRDTCEVESSSDQDNVISDPMNRISTIPATTMSGEKVKPKHSRKQSFRRRSRTELRGNDQF